MRRFLTITSALLLVLAFNLVPNGMLRAPAALAAPPSPPFNQCPAIAGDTSCALLIYIDNTGGVVLQDNTQGPYDYVEDTLIGVQNNSTVTINSIPISGPGIFGFDGDGLCSGTDGNGNPFTPPAGCPFGTTGYEGPNTSFTITDANDGVVNFPGGLAAGQSTYFSLEGAINAADVTLPTTTLTYTGDTSKDYNDTATLSANLVDRNNSPIANQTVNFAAGSQTCAGTTDASGNASCQITVNQSPGSYPITANFPGTSSYIPSQATSSLMVAQEETTLTYTGVTSQDYHDAATVSAVLTDASNAGENESAAAPVANEQVTFSLSDNPADSCVAMTDNTGTASCSITPTGTAGSYSVTATTLGDVNFAGSTTSSPFTVNLEESSVTSSTSLQVLPAGQGDTLSATLLEDGTTPIQGRTLTLQVNGAPACTTGATDATGTASCTVTPTSALGPQAISDSFAGDGYYQSSTNTEQAMVFAFPAAGDFTVGDVTASSGTNNYTTYPSPSVNWWGSQWMKMNKVSSPPPASSTSAFKGFANVTSPAPPACTSGANWATTPGNSPPPPASVPSYMGVIVTSKIAAKSNNTYSGNILHIVVVKVAPGYAPDPSHYGNGTIVATYC